MKKKVLSTAVLFVMLMAFFAVPVFAAKAEADAVVAELQSAGVSGDQLAQATAWLNANPDKITKEKMAAIVADIKAAKAVAGNVTDAKQLSAKQRGDIVKYAQDAAAQAGLELRIDSAHDEAAVFDGGAEISRAKLNPTATDSGSSSVVKQTGLAADFTSIVAISVALAALVGGAVVVGTRKKSGAQA